MRGPSVKTPLLLLLLPLLLSTLTRTVFCQYDEDQAEPETDDAIEDTGDTGDPENPGDPENTSDLENPGDPENPADIEEPVDGDNVQTLDGGDDLSALPPEDVTDVSVPDAPPSEEPPTVDGESEIQSESGSGSEITDIDELGPDSTTDPGTQEALNPIILIAVVLVVLVIGAIVLGIFICRRLKKQTSKPDFEKEDPYLDSPSEEKVPMPMFEEDVPSVLELEMEELDQWMKKDSDNAGESTQT